VYVFTRIGIPRSDQPVGQFMLLPWQPRVYQFFTYQFLHADWEHLLVNMLFLWVFGNSLEDRLGPIGYLSFYLGGGVFAGLGYSLLRDAPMLGASGAIAAVTGAFLALVPLSRVTIAFLFLYFFDVSSMFVILLSVAFDLFYQLSGASGVAYLAHLSGYLFGFCVAMGLLYVRILPREPYDFLALVDRWNRRRQWRDVARGTAIGGAVDPDKPLDEDQRRVMRMRSAIHEALEADDPGRALDTYERLLAEDDTQVMPRDVQFDLANYAMSHQRHGTAARAYELFLQTYPGDGQAGQGELMLAIIYGRYLDDPQRAHDHAARALESLDNPRQRELARGFVREDAT